LVEARQESNNPFNRKSIRGALRAWDNSQQLGGHPLAHLGITEARRRAAGYQETATGRGVALRDVLRDAIDELRPDDADPDPLEKRWRFYITVTEQYLNGLSPDFVAEQLGIERSTYNHGQAEALDTLADILRRWEESHGTPRPTPISLIPRTSAFRGRNQELRYYLKQLEEDHLSIITGMAGTGKTALGAEIAVRFQEKDVVLWFTFRQGINTDIDSLFWDIAVSLYDLGQAELQTFLQHEHEAGARYPLQTKIQHLTHALEAGEWLLCFDNYHLVGRNRDITSLFEILRERAAHRRTISLLIMSQEKPAFTVDMDARPLAGLNREDALDLLTDVGLSRLPKVLFDKVYAVTGGNPLFLKLFSGSVDKHELTGFESPEAAARVHQLVDEMAEASDIQAYLLVRVYNTLSPAGQRLGELMSAFRIPFDDRDEAIIEIFFDAGIEAPPLVLESLVRKYLVNRVGDTGYIDCHPLIRQFFYNRLRSRLPLKRRLHDRIGEYYEHLRADYLEAAYHYREAADYGRSVQLLDTHRERLIGAGKAQRILEVLSPLRSHQTPPPSRPLAAAAQGEAHAFLGEYDKALDRFKEALAGFRDLSMSDVERRRAADIARRIGRLYGWRGDYEKAHTHMEQGLRILGEPADEADRATAALIHTHTGSLHFLQGQYEAAETMCRQALNVLADLPEGDVHAETYKVLGVLHDVTGDWEQATAYARHSLGIWERLGNQHRMAELRDNLGTLHFYRGQFHEAQALYEQNLEFWDRVGARDKAGYARLNLGSIHLHQGEWDTAERYYTQALVAWRQVKNQKLTALAHNNLGLLELVRESYAEAREHLEQSVNEDPNAENYRGIAEAELGLGHPDRALKSALRSLELAQESRERFEEGVTFRILGPHLPGAGRLGPRPGMPRRKPLNSGRAEGTLRAGAYLVLSGAAGSGKRRGRKVSSLPW